MKMSLTTYNRLSFYLNARLSQIGIGVLQNHLNIIKHDSRVKKVSRRFLWDCFYALNAEDKLELTDLFRAEDLTDNHIETALKQAINSSGIANINGEEVTFNSCLPSITL